ncbi:hypothetical protein LJC27_07570 [Christensenellaceae bacterium OttesenSCG-928-M15]|nr:hypothetical protein [Christensenellaceae bacterium OttesenSCG-928-M15]
MNRYEGMILPLNINAILSGHASTNVKTNHPCGNVYQVGWNSIAYFTRNGGIFEDFQIQCFSGTPIIAAPNNIRQVVTRGVATCTAVAIMRGNAMCLLHLDACDLTSHGQAVIETIIAQMTTGIGNIIIFASYIADSDEACFIEGLVQECQDVTGVAVHVRYIIRGSFPEYFGHVEFGVAIESGNLLLYGDRAIANEVLLIDREFLVPFDATQEQVDIALI